MRHRPADGFAVEMNLLPFLDLICSTIGIFIVVFALQEVTASASGRQLAIDYLVICPTDQEVTFYSAPAAEPARFTPPQFPALFAQLAQRQGGVRNLAFAFTSACFDTRRAFEERFAEFTALLHDHRDSQAVFRLAFRPLSSQTGAVEQLLAAWRGGNVRHGP